MSGDGSFRVVRVVVPVTSTSEEMACEARHTSSRYARSVIIAKTSSTPAANSTRDVMSMAAIMARTVGGRLMVECDEHNDVPDETLKELLSSDDFRDRARTRQSGQDQGSGVPRGGQGRRDGLRRRGDPRLPAALLPPRRRPRRGRAQRRRAARAGDEPLRAGDEPPV